MAGPASGGELPVRVLLMARAPLPGRCKSRLQPLLGPDGCARLQRLLIARAAAWGSDVGSGSLQVACTPPEGVAAVAAVVDAGAEVFAQRGDSAEARLSDALTRASGDDDVPLLVIGTDLPALSGAHADAAREDLLAGCDVSVGPAMSGGFYLLCMRPSTVHVFAQPLPSAREAGLIAGVLAAVGAGGLSVGLLRSERDLHTPDDARALLADPLLPDELRAALAPAQAGG